MQLNEIHFKDARPIDGYGPGFFRVGGQVIRGAVLCTQTHARVWGGYDDVASLAALADDIDVIFIGTGAQIAHCPPHIREALDALGIGVETMSSPSACRTYNILLSEGRRVAAALLPVD
ncbi:Mth938-like domain-containing protein [Rhodobacteraceae bacterium]|nr:Mth938-like domain-containing protein [Paracoccaceae bacterium]